ncbi:hypothetical protein PNP85_05360 [Halobacterium salinarum]|uniref:hypothetical protein n=1 Tax=Halobacterium salinarum TaxID=2242 RepID=UPI0025526A32|nr:hypothetical protein [Halobacterium salinarum]MDL0138928.1 hypothetical protein [Halobacterium salinarum]
MENEEYVSSEISPTDTGMARYTTAEVTNFGGELRRLQELRVSLLPRILLL